MASYYALFEPDRKAGGFVITFPDVDSAVSQAENKDEAREMAQDALRTVLSVKIRNGEPIPPARAYRGAKYHRIGLTALEDAKVELYRAFRESGIHKSELARRIGIPKSNLDRLFDLNRKSRFDLVEDAFKALGKRIGIEVRAA